MIFWYLPPDKYFFYLSDVGKPAFILFSANGLFGNESRINGGWGMRPLCKGIKVH